MFLNKKMRPAGQIKVIHSKLDILKDIKLEVQQLQNYMDNILETGTCWIEETDDKKSFFELDQYLMVETSICVGKCLHIATANKELCQIKTEHDTSKYTTEFNVNLPEIEKYEQIFKKYEDSERRMSEIEGIMKKTEEKYLKIVKSIDKQLNKIKNLEQEFQTQKEEYEKNTKQSMQMERSSYLKYQEVMTELHAASNFMSHLNSKTETLTQTVNENKEKLQSLSDKVNVNGELIQNVCPLVDVIQDVQNKLKEQEVPISKLNENFQNSNKQNRELFDTLDRKSQTMEEKLTDLISQSDTLQLKVKEMENNFSKFSQNTHSLRTKLPEILSRLYNLETSTDIDIKFNNISSQVHVMSQQINKLECKNKHVTVNAYSGICSELVLHQDDIIKCMSNVFYTTGDDFDVNTGIFTAPVDGLYLLSASIIIEGDQGVVINILKKDSKGKEHKVGILFGYLRCHGGSNAASVLLKQNDQLYLKSVMTIKISQCVFDFMCTLIK